MIHSIITLTSIVSNISDVQNINQTIPTDLENYNSTELRIFDLHKKIYLQYYYGRTVFEFKTYDIYNGLDILVEPTFNNAQKTVIYMHGYGENPAIHSDEDSIDIIIKELLIRGDVNVIVINYSELVWRIPDSLNIEYIRAISHLPQVGRYLGDFFAEFIRRCRCQERMHLIGFSLGSHVAHYLAKGVQQHGFKLDRITGLEPARPFFEGIIFLEHLVETDALFVDIVHTDAGRLGWNAHAGHADFWPNRGIRPQPPCYNNQLLQCSHYTAAHYYAVSINNPELFPARRCQNGNTWTAGLCDYNHIAYFGYHTTLSYGDYFFSTTASYPYGKGLAGLMHSQYYYLLYYY